MASVKQRSDGKWRARYRDSDGKEHAKHFGLKRDADAWLVDRQSELRAGTWIDPKDSKVTLASFYSDWSQRQVWVPGTLKSFDVSINGCTFKDKPLGKLRRSDVETWVKGLSKTLAPGTVRTRFNNVHAILRGAVRDRLLTVDPSEGVTLPRQRRAEVAMRIPTPGQVGSILESAEEWFRPFVAVAAFAGLRIGELAALQVGDFDFLRQQLSVARQSQAVVGEDVSITPPKYGSERTIGVPARLLTMISMHMTEVGVHGEEQWLFRGKNGLPPEPNSLRYHWGKSLLAARVEGFTPHDLRHFYASGLIAAGLDVVTVQKALGHAKPTTTLNTYSHLWPNAEDRTRSAAADLMSSSLDDPADQMRTRDGSAG